MSQLPELEEECTACHGGGGDGHGDACHCCSGIGWVLTETGEKVFSMVEHFQPLLQPTIGKMVAAEFLRQQGRAW